MPGSWWAEGLQSRSALLSGEAVQGALIQCRKALVPDGLLLGAMLGGDSLQELRISCALAEQELEGGVASRISPLARVLPCYYNHMIEFLS